jgi:hypothetical protein
MRSDAEVQDQPQAQAAKDEGRSIVSGSTKGQRHFGVTETPHLVKKNQRFTAEIDRRLPTEVS